MNKKFRNYMVSKSMSKHTIRNYTSDIEGCLNYIGKPDNEITYSDLIDWKASISHQSSATVARKVVSVRRYFDYLSGKSVAVLDNNPAQDLESPTIENKLKTALTGSEVRDMIDSALNVRNKAIISILASTGMRVSELIELTLDQYKQNPVIIKGKGGKYGKVYIAPEVRAVVDEYLATRKESVHPNVFLSHGDKPMQSNNITLMIKNTAKRAGLDNWEEVSAHWLRTAAATMQSEAGQPIEVIQQILRHKNVATTRRYIKVAERRVEQAMTTLLF